jgi:hypothetical protein
MSKREHVARGWICSWMDPNSMTAPVCWNPSVARIVIQQPAGDPSLGPPQTIQRFLCMSHAKALADLLRPLGFQVMWSATIRKAVDGRRVANESSI